MRIVSLLPSATEIVHLLGLTDSLVGRSEECNHPAEIANVPVVSIARIRSAEVDGLDIDSQVRAAVASGQQLYLIDEQLLHSLVPDIIITQDLCRVCAVSSGEVCDVGARVVSLDPKDIQGVAESVHQLADALDYPTEGHRVVQEMLRRIEITRARVAGRRRPKVFFAEWLSPPFASGHWIPEMIEAAGGQEVLGIAGVPSRAVSWATVRQAQPEIVILGPCGFDQRRAEAESQAIQHEFDPSWRVVSVDADRYFARPAPSIADGVEQLAEIFHFTS